MEVVLDTTHITSVASAGRQDLTLSKPTTVSVGDFLLFLHARSGGIGWGTVNAGLVAGTAAQTGDTSGHLLIRPYTRIADGTESATYIWDATVTGYRSGLGLRFTGNPTIRESRSVASTLNGVGTGQSTSTGSAWVAHAGDYALLVLAASWDSVLTVPAGWTRELLLEQGAGGTASHDLHVFSRTYAAYTSDQPSVTNSGVAASVVGLAWLFEGVPPENPFVGHWRYRFDTIT